MCQHRMSTTEIPLGQNAVSLDMVAQTVLLKCTLAFLNDMIAISPSNISDVGSFRQMTHGSTGLIPVVRRTPFQGEKKGGGFPFNKLYFEEYHLKFERIWFQRDRLMNEFDQPQNISNFIHIQTGSFSFLVCCFRFAAQLQGFVT